MAEHSLGKGEAEGPIPSCGSKLNDQERKRAVSTIMVSMTTTTPTLDSFRDLTTEELIVLGLLWKYFTEIDPSERWGTARETILASLTPEDGADIRSAHAARVESEGWDIPIECYAGLQWSYLAEREKEKMPKLAYKDTMRAWNALSPSKGRSDDVVSEIAERAKITEDGFFDLSGSPEPRTIGSPPPEPDWDDERMKARLTELVSALLTK